MSMHLLKQIQMFNQNLNRYIFLIISIKHIILCLYLQHIKEIITVFALGAHWIIHISCLLATIIRKFIFSIRCRNRTLAKKAPLFVGVAGLILADGWISGCGWYFVHNRKRSLTYWNTKFCMKTIEKSRQIFDSIIK